MSSTLRAYTHRSTELVTTLPPKLPHEEPQGNGHDDRDLPEHDVQVLQSGDPASDDVRAAM